MSIVLDGTAGITSPGGDTASVSLATPILKSPSSLTLQTNGSTTALTIATNQFVGIGTNNPQNLLHAVSSITLNTDSSYPIAAGDSGSIGKRMVMGYFPTGSSGNNGFGVIQSVYTGVQWSPTVINPNGGNVLIGTSTNNTSGGVLQVSNGITFPATQSASSNANTLDDYEEGAWTPILSGTGSAPTVTYSIQAAYYTKIGDRVLFQLALGWSARTGGSGAATFSLPFPTNSASNSFPSFSVGYSSGVTGTADSSYTDPSVAYAFLRQNATGGTLITVADISSGGGLVMISGQYFI